MFNFRLVFRILGFLLFLEGLFILLCVPVSLIYREGMHLEFCASSLINILAGSLLMIATWNADKNLQMRDGFIVVSIGWVLISLFGSFPFIITGAIPSFTNAFFETVSGFTTTGASILDDIESLPRSLLFWRSIIQWLGGMGIIVMSLAIFPLLGIGGAQLFDAESPGPTVDKLHPRIKETARRLWFIYIIFTVAEIILLAAGGMSLFDSINHSFTTMATGGYSTKQLSLGYWDSPFIHYVIILFMFLAGVNFTLSYFAFHLDFKKIIHNEEFRLYCGLIIVFAIVSAIVLHQTKDDSWEQSIRHGLFQVVSVMTTTGFVTTDYCLWVPLLQIMLVILMFLGGSAGSTAGGIKVVRIFLFFKNGFLELKRIIHPNAVIPVRINKNPVSPETMNNVFGFISFYLLATMAGIIAISAMGYDLGSSLSAAATALGNVGPGLRDFGPAVTFSHAPFAAKWILAFLMLIGRLELFTVLMLLSPGFWRK
jgi:trk system potassium uptake protein TrkH